MFTQWRNLTDKKSQSDKKNAEAEKGRQEVAEAVKKLTILLIFSQPLPTST